MQTIDEALEKLQASPFRAKFRLSERERAYIGEKGLDTIREHARGFIETRLAPGGAAQRRGGRPPCGDTRCSSPQHACACCCRKCLYKWYKIPPGHPAEPAAAGEDRESADGLDPAAAVTGLRRRQRGAHSDDRSSGGPDQGGGDLPHLPAPGHKARGRFGSSWAERWSRGRPGRRPWVRECREELDIRVAVGEPFMEVIHAYPDLTVHLTLFHASIAEGTPRKLEHQDIRWIRAAEIPQYRFCPADEAILERLREVAGCGGPTQVGR